MKARYAGLVLLVLLMAGGLLAFAPRQVSAEALGGTWTSSTNYPANRAYTGCSAYSGYIYCVGGSSSTSATYYAQLSSSGIGSWSSGTAYPVTIFLSSCVTSGGYIYCIGGYHGADVNSVYSSPISSSGFGTWTLQTNHYPIVIEDPACDTDGSYIYCVGGYSGTGVVANVYFASISSGTVGSWSAGTSYPTGTEEFSCTYYSGRLYCTTGNTGSATNASYFATASGSGVGSWTSTTVYPLSSYWTLCTSSSGYLYCVGGLAGSYTNNVYYSAMSSSGLGAWTSATAYPLTTSGIGCVTSAGYIYCVGGSNGGGATRNTYYDSITSPTVTLPISCSLAESGATTGTFSVSGGSPAPSPATISCSYGGTTTNVIVQVSTTITVTVQADGGTTRYRFSSGTTTSTTSCASGTCSTWSITAYYELSNTYAMVPSTPSVWDASYSKPAVGTVAGVGSSTVCSVSLSNGGGSANCAGWADYNNQVSLPSTFSSSVAGTWTASDTRLFTDTTGGNTHTTHYNLVLADLMTCTMANSAPQATVTLSGGSINPTTILCDGSAHSFSVLYGATVTATEPADGSNTRDRFSNSGAVTSIQHSTFPWSFTNYYQLQNTYTMTPTSPGSWDASYTKYAVGTFLGTGGTNICTESLGAGVAGGVLIPLYVDPPSSYWTTVETVHASYPSVPMVVIANPNNGPGSSSQSNYVSAISMMQGDGITVIGYVYTSYGARPIGDVETDISNWHSWYGVTGILFDEMASTAGSASYYSTLVSYTNGLGMTLTVGNPGDQPDQSYYGIMSVLDIYESTGMPDLSSINYYGYPKADFSYVAIGVPSLSQTAEVSSTAYVAYLYITDASGGNPYDVLPSYFSTEVSYLNSGGGGPASCTGWSDYNLSVSLSSGFSSSVSGVWSATTTYTWTDTTGGNTHNTNYTLSLTGETITCTMANSAPGTPTIALSGGGITPTSIPCDGAPHSVSYTAGMTITATEPADGSSSRYRFNQLGSPSSTVTSIFTPWLISNYLQYSNTYTANLATTHTTWGSGLSAHAQGYSAGIASFTICTMSPSSGTNTPASCSGFSDYNQPVVFQSPMAGSPAGTRYATASAVSDTPPTSGNTYYANYFLQYSNTYTAVPLKDTVWDNSFSITVSAFIGGVSGNSCTIAAVASSGSASCTGWGDNDTVSTVQQVIPDGAHFWEALPPNTAQFTSSGNTLTVDYVFSAYSVVPLKCTMVNVSPVTATFAGDASPTPSSISCDATLIYVIVTPNEMLNVTAPAPTAYIAYLFQNSNQVYPIATCTPANNNLICGEVDLSLTQWQLGSETTTITRVPTANFTQLSYWFLPFLIIFLVASVLSAMGAAVGIAGSDILTLFLVGLFIGSLADVALQIAPFALCIVFGVLLAVYVWKGRR